MTQKTHSSYVFNGGPKGLPVIGMFFQAIKDPLQLITENGLRYGDVIPYKVMGWNVVQLNHPDFIRHVLIDNHKNYIKSESYIRFESVLGQGLITSNGEKWRRDRQKIQPMFKREQIEGYYFTVVNEVAERYKRRWLDLTEKGPAEINITQEMAAFTLEVIVKLIFGKENLSRDDVLSLHLSADIFMSYLKDIRMLPRVDMRRIFHTPSYLKFKRERDKFYTLIDSLIAQYKAGQLSDQFNMLALLLDAQKQAPTEFTQQDIRDQCATMIFAGFETTSVLIQWLWYVLDGHPNIERKICEEIQAVAPSCFQKEAGKLDFSTIAQMDYLTMVFKETMRLYPSFWVTSREPVEEDNLGGYRVQKKSVIVLPQYVMHRHPRYWEEPNTCRPERFMPENEVKIDDGIYFPFSHGARKCSGYRLAELETKLFITKLLPLFKVKILNSLGNGFDPGISLQPKVAFKAQITRRV